MLQLRSDLNLHNSVSNASRGNDVESSCWSMIWSIVSSRTTVASTNNEVNLTPVKSLCSEAESKEEVGWYIGGKE